MLGCLAAVIAVPPWPTTPIGRAMPHRFNGERTLMRILIARANQVSREKPCTKPLLTTSHEATRRRPPCYRRCRFRCLRAWSIQESASPSLATLPIVIEWGTEGSHPSISPHPIDRTPSDYPERAVIMYRPANVATNEREAHRIEAEARELSRSVSLSGCSTR